MCFHDSSSASAVFGHFEPGSTSASACSRKGQKLDIFENKKHHAELIPNHTISYTPKASTRFPPVLESSY